MWRRFSEENVQRSKRERDTSVKLCNAIRQSLRSCTYEVLSHFTVVNASFKNKIYNLKVSKNNLEAQLLQVGANVCVCFLCVLSFRESFSNNKIVFIYYLFIFHIKPQALRSTLNNPNTRLILRNISK